jgi:hypothetical protein
MGASKQILTTVAGLALALTAAVISRPAYTATAADLKLQYQGRAHHNTKPGNESLEIDLDVTSVQPNGHFTGNLGGFLIQGKVDGSGKMAFAGQFTRKGGTVVKLKDGKGQVSATGLHLLGTFKLNGDTAVSDLNGPYTFEEHALVNFQPASSPLFSQSEIHAEATVGNLGPIYSGAAHNKTNPDTENSPITLTVTQTQTNGKFKGFLGDTPISGKVTPQGKITFAGSKTDKGNTTKINDGAGQLSATGLFILGQFKINFSAFPGDSGTYLFEVEEES